MEDGDLSDFWVFILDSLVNCGGLFLMVRDNGIDEGLCVGRFGQIKTQVVSLKQVADWAKICESRPTLAMCLDYADNEKGELKCANAAINLLRSLRVKFIIYSRHPEVLRQISENDSRVITGLLVEGKISELPNLLKLWSDAGSDYLATDFEEPQWQKFLALADYIETHCLKVKLWVRMGDLAAYCGTFMDNGIGIVTNCYSSWLATAA